MCPVGCRAAGLTTYMEARLRVISTHIRMRDRGRHSAARLAHAPNAHTQWLHSAAHTTRQVRAKRHTAHTDPTHACTHGTTAARTPSTSLGSAVPGSMQHTSTRPAALAPTLGTPGFALSGSHPESCRSAEQCRVRTGPRRKADRRAARDGPPTRVSPRYPPLLFSGSRPRHWQPRYPGSRPRHRHPECGAARGGGCGTEPRTRRRPGAAGAIERRTARASPASMHAYASDRALGPHRVRIEELSEDLRRPHSALL